jgi:hypothetical protein
MKPAKVLSLTKRTACEAGCTLPTYRATVAREDNLWVAVVADLPGGATDVERITGLDLEVRDLIAGLRDIDPDDFEIEWHYEQGGQDRERRNWLVRAAEEYAPAVGV